MSTATATVSQAETKTGGNSPIATFRDRGVSVSVFANEGKTGKLFYTASIESRYQDKESGEWRTSKSFDEDQIAVLADFARQARDAIRDARAQQKAAAKV